MRRAGRITGMLAVLLLLAACGAGAVAGDSPSDPTAAASRMAPASGTVQAMLALRFLGGG
ncbi:MAG TPA: hypothetical protein VLA19_06390 [Herpetosiphonaceae bacterium]|nr:hypothetical protein [Herpetosiphonaceae bacterium]